MIYIKFYKISEEHFSLFFAYSNYYSLSIRQNGHFQISRVVSDLEYIYYNCPFENQLTLI